MTSDDLRLLAHGLFWAAVAGIYVGGASWLQGYVKSPLLPWAAAIVALGVVAAVLRRAYEKDISSSRLLRYGLRVAALFSLYFVAAHWLQRHSQSWLAGIGLLAAWVALASIVEHYAERNSKQLKD